MVRLTDAQLRTRITEVTGELQLLVGEKCKRQQATCDHEWWSHYDLWAAQGQKDYYKCERCGLVDRTGALRWS